MMNNDKAIEKLAAHIYRAMRFDRRSTTPSWAKGGNSTAQGEARMVGREILAAIQADPLVYVRPKPLRWSQLDLPSQLEAGEKGVWNGNAALGFHYEICKTPEGFVWYPWGGVYRYSDPLPTLESAQAAAYDDLCKRMKELF